MEEPAPPVPGFCLLYNGRPQAASCLLQKLGDTLPRRKASPSQGEAVSRRLTDEGAGKKAYQRPLIRPSVRTGAPSPLWGGRLWMVPAGQHGTPDWLAPLGFRGNGSARGPTPTIGPEGLLVGAAALGGPLCRFQLTAGAAGRPGAPGSPGPAWPGRTGSGCCSWCRPSSPRPRRCRGWWTRRPGCSPP